MKLRPYQHVLVFLLITDIIFWMGIAAGMLLRQVIR